MSSAAALPYRDVKYVPHYLYPAAATQPRRWHLLMAEASSCTNRGGSSHKMNDEGHESAHKRTTTANKRCASTGGKPGDPFHGGLALIVPVASDEDCRQA